MPSDAYLVLRNVSKRFSPRQQPAVWRVNLSAGEGCLLALLGPSGCGKTTLLRLIAGFEAPDEGSICLAGRKMAGEGNWTPPEHRGVGMVFQDFALFPHLTVYDNVAFGLRYSSWRGRDAGRRATHVIEVAGLRGIENRYPHEISGGQQQRVAVARALAPKPQLIVMDEPLSNLDVQMRLRLRHELRAMLKSERVTGVLVTHDQEEALSIADQVAVMRDGGIEQAGRPEDLYETPETRFVAEFVTQANFLPARKAPGGFVTEIGHLPFGLSAAEDGEQGELMIRQEDLRLSPDEHGAGVIVDRRFLGREYTYRVETDDGRVLLVRAPVSPALMPGSRVAVFALPDRVRFFPGERSLLPAALVEA